MNESKPKTCKKRYRLPPCPAYDVEGMESWLADQALDGWFLCTDGFFAGIAVFELREPADVRYRLDAAPRGTSLLSENGGEPDEEAKLLSASFGWEYVSARGKFHIYRTAEHDARELNTDPQVQAFALDTVRRQERTAAILALFWVVLYPILRLRGNLLLTMLTAGSGFVLFGIGLALVTLVTTVARVIHLGSLRRRLLTDGVINHDKPWRKGALDYRVRSLLMILLIVLWTGLLISMWGDRTAGDDRQPLSVYEGDPPFATVTDLMPEGEYIPIPMGSSNTFSQRSDWLAPVVIDWQEFAGVTLPDGERHTMGLFVDYYDTQTPWLARQLVKEVLRADGVKQDTQRLELPPLEIDEALAYQNETHMTVILLRQENRVLHALIIQSDAPGALTLRDNALKLADSIR